MANGFKNITVTYGNKATINTGNFQNLNPEYRVSVDLEEGLHPNEARKRLKTLVDGWINEDIESIQAELRALQSD